MSGFNGLITVFPRTIAGATFFFFFASKGGNHSREENYLGEAIISNIVHGNRAINILF